MTQNQIESHEIILSYKKYIKYNFGDKNEFINQ